MPGQVFYNPKTGQPMSRAPIAAGTRADPTLPSAIYNWFEDIPVRRAQQEAETRAMREQYMPGPLPNVAQPGMFGGSDDIAAKAAEGLQLAQRTYSSPSSSPGDAVSDDISGFSGYDRGAIRRDVPGFLAAGNARREAEDAEDARRAQAALFPGGRTGEDVAQSNMALRRLQQARQELDPAYQREQDVRDAATFTDPRMVRRREMQTREGLDEKRGMGELALKLGISPNALFQDAVRHQRMLDIEKVRASGRNIYGSLAASAGIPRGTDDPNGPLTEAEVIQHAKDNGWTQEELDFALRKVRAGGG